MRSLKSAHVFATQNAVNRKNMSESMFKAGVDHDTITNDYKENTNLMMYMKDGNYVAWYNYKVRGGYVSAHGLKNNG